MSKLGTRTRPEIQHAIDCVKAGRYGLFKTPSTTTYVLCPVGNELWDIKPVGGVAWEEENITSKTQTDDFFRPIIKAGFKVVKFDKQKERTLGIRGCDLSELAAEHTVHYPDGREVENGFKPVERTAIFPDGTTKTFFSSRRVRNSAYVRAILALADGFCHACSDRIFQKPDGTWFLEAHHKTWLSEEGPDIPENMVALCPNCHRQEHHGTNRRYPKRNWI